MKKERKIARHLDGAARASSHTRAATRDTRLQKRPDALTFVEDVVGRAAAVFAVVRLERYREALEALRPSGAVVPMTPRRARPRRARGGVDAAAAASGVAAHRPRRSSGEANLRPPPTRRRERASEDRSCAFAENVNNTLRRVREVEARKKQSIISDIQFEENVN